MKSYRIGFVNYINTYPFVIPWKQNGISGWDIIEESPTKLNIMLREGEIVAGIVSSFEVLENSNDYVVLPFCISAMERVRSVLLISKTDISNLQDKKIILTPQSASSVNLLKIILEIFLGIRAKYLSGEFNDFRGNNEVSSYLSIGDEALYISKYLGKGYFIYDLANLWYNRVCLPFVFALWAVRKDFYMEKGDTVLELREKLSNLLKRGMELVRGKSREILINPVLTPEECYDYLSDIQYNMDRDRINSLKKYFDYLVKLSKLKGEFQINLL